MCLDSLGASAQAVFNCRRTNLRGEQFRVLVGETQEAGEGTSFMNVRRLILMDTKLDLDAMLEQHVRFTGGMFQ